MVARSMFLVASLPAVPHPPAVVCELWAETGRPTSRQRLGRWMQ